MKDKQKKVEYDKFGKMRDKEEADMFNKHAIGYCEVCGGLVTDNGNSKALGASKVTHRGCSL